MNNENTENSTENKKLNKIKFRSLKKSELSKLAKDIAMDKVFCSFFVPETQQENLLGMIFMPILFGATKDYSKEEIDDIGFIYEYYDKAGPRGINGYPIFFSCGFVGKNDARKIRDKVIKIKKMIESA
jgi:hypothetical protein